MFGQKLAGEAHATGRFILNLYPLDETFAKFPKIP